MTRDNSKFKKYYNEYEPTIIGHMAEKKKYEDELGDRWLASRVPPTAKGTKPKRNNKKQKKKK